MKRLFLMKCLLFSVLAAIPSLGWSNGIYTPGQVTLYNNNTYMVGAYNVRHNPAVSTGKVFAGLNPGSSLTISGTDSSTGAGFFCSLTSASPLFANAEKVIYSLGDGSLLIATRTSTTNSTCSGVQIQTGSNQLH